MVLVRINVIVPKQALFDYGKFTSTVKDTLRRKTEPDLKRIFRGTTQGWKTQPEFKADHFSTNNTIGVQVFTTNAAYGIVNAGSPSHMIRPKNRGGFLRFQTGYSPATRPGSLSSGPYRRSGQFVAAQMVRHPGFRARKFDEQIVDVYSPIFAEDMAKTFEGGVP